MLDDPKRPPIKGAIPNHYQLALEHKLTPEDDAFCFANIEAGLGFDGDDPACVVCAYKRDCAKKTQDKLQGFLERQNRAALGVIESEFFEVPKEFTKLESAVLSRLPEVSKIGKRKSIVYYYKGKHKFLTITKPYSKQESDILGLILYGKKKIDYRDPKKRLKESRGKVFAIIQKNQVGYGYTLIKQAYKSVKTKSNLFRK